MGSIIYCNYTKDHPDRVDGYFCIEEVVVEKQPKDVVVFSVSNFDFNLGGVIKQDGKYIPYFGCVEGYWDYMDLRNFGSPQTSFKLALEVLAEEQNYKIVLKPPFYKKEFIEKRTVVDLP
jgi:hypothetical protein